MATNILALPLVTMTVETSNNEDWIDSLKFLVEEEGVPIEDLDQLDLRGIYFEMEVRRSAADHEVVLYATTDDGTLAIGLPPNFGFLIINIPVAQMKTKDAGVYVGDIVARADGLYRVTIRMTLTIIEGVTKWP
jgi:hypothetical protein